MLESFVTIVLEQMLKNKGFIVLLSILFTLHYQSYGQYKNPKVKDRFLQLDINTLIIKTQDEATSPLLYKGAGAGGRLEYLSYREKSLHQLYLSGGVGLLEPITGNELADASATSINGTFAINYLRDISVQNETVGLWVGGGVFNYGHARINSLFSNSAVSYETLFSLAVSSRLEGNFKIFNRDITGLYQLTLPLAGYSLRTFYATPLEAGAPYGDAATIVNFPFINSRLGMMYPVINKHNRIGLSYEWTYYSFSRLNQVKNAIHTFNFFIMFKL